MLLRQRTFLYIVFLLCLSLFSHCYAAETWLSKALRLQNEIDRNTPLNQATFIGTHNSYNAKAYQTPCSYIYPNQSLSLYDQLETGVRSLELDVHWTLNEKLHYDILLCHGTSAHTGCSIYDRKVEAGLAEIKKWLQAHPKEIILLYFERHLDGHDAELAKRLDAYLGNNIFKTTSFKQNIENSCVSLPSTLTKGDVLRAGKQIIVITKGCSKAPTLNSSVFAGSGNIPKHPFTLIDALIKNFQVSDCGKSVFSDDSKHSSLWRIFEDGRKNLPDPNRKFLRPEDMINLLRCGINWPAVDMLEKNDKRLIATIWSWAPLHPSTDHLSKHICALYKERIGMIDVPCREIHIGYLCKNDATSQFKVISSLGSWSNGLDACKKKLGSHWHFATPINSLEMSLVKTSMAALALPEVWLNYAVNDQGNWVPNIQEKK